MGMVPVKGGALYIFMFNSSIDDLKQRFIPLYQLHWRSAKKLLLEQISPNRPGVSWLPTLQKCKRRRLGYGRFSKEGLIHQVCRRTVWLK